MTDKEKELAKIIARHNKGAEKLYEITGDKTVLESYHTDIRDPKIIAQKFGINEEDALGLIKKWEAQSIGSKDECGEEELYTKAFEFVAESGNEYVEDLSKRLQISEEKASALIREMRKRGDIASSESDELDDEDDFDDTVTDEYTDDDDTEDFDDVYVHPTQIIQDALSFIGDVVSDTSEKICDALDESLEKVLNHDFND